MIFKKSIRISLNFHVPGPPQAFPRAPLTLGNLPASIEIHTEHLKKLDVLIFLTVVFRKNVKIEVLDPLTMWNQLGSSRAFEIWHRDLQALSRDRVMIIFLNLGWSGK